MIDILIVTVVGGLTAAVLWKKVKDHRSGKSGCGCGSCGGCPGCSSRGDCQR